MSEFISSSETRGELEQLGAVASGELVGRHLFDKADAPLFDIYGTPEAIAEETSRVSEALGYPVPHIPIERDEAFAKVQQLRRGEV